MTLDAPSTAALHHLSAAEAASLIAARRISPVELVDAFLDRAETTQGATHAYIEILADRARAAAKAAEAKVMSGDDLGALHGVPFAVKDNYHVEGVRTTGGSRLMLDHVADHTAVMISRLQDAGAILMGKLNTWEYGTGSGEVHDDLPFPLARNPWNPERFTGGSSTGAGVAVSTGSACFALGSDTGGSVRLPAAATGVQGIKATFGRLPRTGILPNCWSADIGGPLGWTVTDNALALQVMAGHDASDPQSVDRPVDDYLSGLEAGVKGLKLAVMTGFGDDSPFQPEVQANFETMVEVLRAEGAEIVEIACPAPLSLFRSVLSNINWGESFSIHEADFMERHHLMGKALRDKMMSGFMLRAADYIAAQRLRRDLGLKMEAAVAEFDAVLLPTTTVTAPRFGDQEALIRFSFGATTPIHSCTGHPAMAVATGFDADGMPTSGQIAGRHFDEATVLRVARAYERAADARTARPDL